jgi:hypothetical protein
LRNRKPADKRDLHFLGASGNGYALRQLLAVPAQAISAS